jgi:hypothetical protein
MFSRQYFDFFVKISIEFIFTRKLGFKLDKKTTQATFLFLFKNLYVLLRCKKLF